MENEWLSVREVSSKVGVGETTLRRYLRDHSSYIAERKVARNRRQISGKSIGIIKRIAELYASGMTRDQVEEELRKKEVLNVVVSADQDRDITLADQYQELKKILYAISEQNARLVEQNEQLREKHDEMRKELQELKSKIDQIEAKMTKKKSFFRWFR